MHKYDFLEEVISLPNYLRLSGCSTEKRCALAKISGPE
jgi:hypothetical protein